MVEVFPIVDLMNQLEAINQYVTSHLLSRVEIFMWFSTYGSVTMFAENRRVFCHRENIDYFVKVSYQGNVFGYYSRFGFIHGFVVESERNQILLFKSHELHRNLTIID